MGSYTGDSSTNPRGNMIYRWLQEHNFILWNQRLAYGKPTFIAHQGSSIIDFFMSDTELCNPSLTIWEDLSLDSAHKMISFSFHPSILPEVHNQQPRITWRLTKLQEAKTRNQYIQSFQNATNNISMSIENNNLQPQDQQSARGFIEKLNDDICQAIYMSLDSICGRICQQTDPMKDFWTAEMRQAYEAREYYYRKWRKAYGLNKLHFWLQHQQARATLRRLIHQRRRENWRRFCHQMAIGEYTKAISRLSRIRKHRTLRPAFSTPQGPQHAADIMASHLENVFSGQLLREVQINNIYNPILPFEIECPITAEDIQEAIRNLPTKKAPGVDHLRNEMLRPIQHLLTPLLLSLFRLCWMWSYTPQSWRVAQVVPIYKKGSTDEPSNYRPISLTSIFRKILERCIQYNLQTDGPSLDIAQGGFRESRGALDQALCLAEICHILRSHYHSKPVLAFLDIKSAYDTVDRNHVWKVLQHCISAPLLGLLRNLFDEVQIEVLVSNATSRRFHPKTGVLQGSILSPYLYSVYINQLPHHS
ncbi:hypothetical protein G6F35_005580 [Rhizopus arrhizus]|nr:hypothetical protein G6F35_005580 [Rhizopus arrhizus]